MIRELTRWPVTKTNTLLNICPVGEVHVVERLGKLESVQEAGMYFRVPIVDRVKYRIDVRERAIPIHPQHAITRDNVSVELDGVLYLKVVDPVRCAYNVTNPLLSVVQHAQSTMRAAIGRVSLDDAFHCRNDLNADICGAIGDAAADWGLEVRRYEVLGIRPDEAITRAMDLQATAERKRREEVTNAEAQKVSELLRAEGEAGAIERVAEAAKLAAILKADGVRQARALEAAGEAEAIASIAKALGGTSEAAATAASIKLAEGYFRTLGEIGSHSNTVFFGGRGEPASDLTDIMARLTATVEAVNATGGAGGGVKALG